jgi:endoglucanase
MGLAACQKPVNPSSSDVNPIVEASKSLVQMRFERLGKGMNYSRYAWYWSRPSFRPDFVSPTRFAEVRSRFQLLKELGFSSVRVPIDFYKWKPAMSPAHPFWAGVDNTLNAAKKAKLVYVLDYQYGVLTSKNLRQDTDLCVRHWKMIAQRYASTNPDSVFFDLFNEPENQISTADWHKAASEIVQAIRETGGNNATRPIIIGGTNWNDLGDPTWDSGLLTMPALADSNIIYTFHFYDPKHFTHQGVPQANNVFRTLNVPFPCDPAKMPQRSPSEPEGTSWYWQNYCGGLKMGFEAFVQQRFKLAHDWGVKYHAPVWIGEWGMYRGYATDEDTSRYLNLVVKSAQEYGLLWSYWDMECVLSPFDPVRKQQEICEVWQRPMRIYTREGMNPIMCKTMGLNCASD